MDDTGEIPLGYPRWCFAAGSVLSAAGLVLSGWLAAHAAAVAAVALAASCAAWALGMVLGAVFVVRWRPVWRVGPEGIAVLGAGRVAWDDISGVGPWRRGTSVRIALRDPAAWACGRPVGARVSAALRGVPLCSPFVLGLSGLDTGREDIRRAVERHAPGRWRSAV